MFWLAINLLSPQIFIFIVHMKISATNIPHFTKDILHCYVIYENKKLKHFQEVDLYL